MVSLDSITCKKKRAGAVYTPVMLVRRMLDWVGYGGQDIIRRHIIDNSCGDGAFLVEAVERYILASHAMFLPAGLIARHLATYIHGIETDADACERCRANLDRLVLQYGLRHVRWDIRNADALTVTAFDGRMAFVVGNPPYVRNHNVSLSADVRNRYCFMQQGNADLYLAFYELGFRMLSPHGRMCYIAPVSWVYSNSGAAMRSHVRSHGLLAEVVDMGHFHVFKGVSTYTLVTLFSGAGSAGFTYSVFDDVTCDKAVICTLSSADAFIDDRLYFGTHAQLQTLRQIRSSRFPKHFTVKNGFATLANSLFFNDDIPLSPFTIPVLKASRGRWYKGFFPYDAYGHPVTVDELKAHPRLMAYLTGIKSSLLKRDSRDAGWWLYRRTQGLCDVHKPRMAVNCLLRSSRDLHLHRLQPGNGVYGGFYILADSVDRLDTVDGLLSAPEFMDFVRLLRIYKGGGYYEFRAKDLEQYLNYAYSCQVTQ